jgi:exodeoxyribonuclease-3
MIVKDIRIANIYLPNGNPVGSEKFAYKLAWMDRLGRQLALWLQSDAPTVVGGDFNVIPEDIDYHKPTSWVHDPTIPGPLKHQELPKGSPCNARPQLS